MTPSAQDPPRRRVHIDKNPPVPRPPEQSETGPRTPAEDTPNQAQPQEPDSSAVQASQPGEQALGGFDTLRDADNLFRPNTPRSPHWSIVWSDLMMTMFILFLVMFIYHSAHREFKYGRGATGNLGAEAGEGNLMGSGAYNVEGLPEPSQDTSDRIPDLTRKTLKARSLNEAASVDLIADQAVRIVLPSDLLFDTGKAEIKPGARRRLNQVANRIRNSDYVVNVVGHTDDVPIHSDKFATNWELSSIRACVVARYLIEQMGLAPERFFVSGFSYYQPAKPNTSAANREANRRVEIILLKEMPYLPPIQGG